MALGWRRQYLRYKEVFLNIMALYKSRNDLRMFVEVILSLVTIIIFSLFALKPTALTIIELVKEIREKEKTVSELDKKIVDLKTAKVVFTQEEIAIPAIESSVPDEPRPEIFAQQVEKIAGKNSVNILAVSVEEVILVGEVAAVKKKASDLAALPSGSQEMPVSITVSGDYINLVSFLQDLENMRRPIKIDSFGINASVSPEGITLVAAVVGRVPFLEH